MLSRCRTVIIPSGHILVSSYYHTITLSDYHILILSWCRTNTLRRCHTITIPHCHTVIKSYNDTAVMLRNRIFILYHLTLVGDGRHPPARYRFGRARVGLAEARFSQHKSFFRNFWSHGPQNRCIWSKISRGNWFWRLELSIPSKIHEKLRKTDFRNPKNQFFPESFFRRFGDRQAS